LMQQIGKLFVGGRDPNGIGRDGNDIARIIAGFSEDGGLH
jgi:hypothetical protein